MKVTTSFGEVAIPFSKIDGIKLHADASDSSVIAFKNGDLITGKVVLDQVTLSSFLTRQLASVNGVFQKHH